MRVAPVRSSGHAEACKREFGVDGFEVCIDVCGGDGSQRRGRPIRVAVFVDDLGPNAFDGRESSAMHTSDVPSRTRRRLDAMRSRVPHCEPTPGLDLLCTKTSRGRKAVPIGSNRVAP